MITNHESKKGLRKILSHMPKQDLVSIAQKVKSGLKFDADKLSNEEVLGMIIHNADNESSVLMCDEILGDSLQFYLGERFSFEVRKEEAVKLLLEKWGIHYITIQNSFEKDIRVMTIVDKI